MLLYYFFFFQAEDGIRDIGVTGVQTCALPIYPYDDNGHGTFISGIICGNGYSSDKVYKGIAEKGKIYMIKAFNNVGRGFISDILSSIDIIISESENYNIKIICLPFEIVEYNKFVL